MTETQSTADQTLTEWAEANGVTRPELVLGATLSGVLLLLAQDPELRDMFEQNDREHFMEGCKSPAFVAKFGQALGTVREMAA